MERNSVRYNLDFIVIPTITENNGVEFVNDILESHGSVLCDIFNSYYDEFGNSTFFKECPKHFNEDQFNVTVQDFDNNIKIVYISLPDEHTGSFVYCTAYAFACRTKDSRITSCSMYTVEKSMSNTTCIGKMHEGMHMNYGFATGSADKDIQAIKKLLK